MKKKKGTYILLAGLLALVMVAGCAGFKDFIGLAAEKVCGFSLQESQEAQMALAFISNAAPVVGAIAGVPITAAQAEAIFNQIAVTAQTGGCVLLTDFNNAIAFFDSLVAQYNEATKAKKYKALFTYQAPSIAVLRARLK